MSRALAAVDVKDFARHKGGPFEIHDGADDVGNLAHTADRLQGASTAGTPAMAWSTRLAVICTIWPLPRFSISAMASCVM